MQKKLPLLAILDTEQGNEDAGLDTEHSHAPEGIGYKPPTEYVLHDN